LVYNLYFKIVTLQKIFYFCNFTLVI
jgi:hypothetical protein